MTTNYLTIADHLTTLAIFVGLMLFLVVNSILYERAVRRDKRSLSEEAPRTPAE